VLDGHSGPTLRHGTRTADVITDETVPCGAPGCASVAVEMVQDFAERTGTSRSRLSTYMSGKVMPSAALMVRMRRVALQASGTAAHAGG
jgi:transcriptional regulator with XRE-family HTH domain